MLALLLGGDKAARHHNSYCDHPKLSRVAPLSPISKSKLQPRRVLIIMKLKDDAGFLSSASNSCGSTTWIWWGVPYCVMPGAFYAIHDPALLKALESHQCISPPLADQQPLLPLSVSATEICATRTGTAIRCIHRIQLRTLYHKTESLGCSLGDLSPGTHRVVDPLWHATAESTGGPPSPTHPDGELHSPGAAV